MAKQEILPCPMPGCGTECEIVATGFDSDDSPYSFGVICMDDSCGYCGCEKESEALAIAAHNEVSRNNAAAPDMLDALYEVEWTGGAKTECPLCGAGSMGGKHTADCQIGRAIAKATPEKENENE